MPWPRLPIGRVAAVIALIVGTIAIVRGVDRPRWRALGHGVEFTTLSGEPFCRRGSSHVAVLRLDPARVDLRVLHYTHQPEREPLPLLEWQKRSGALAVFNAGQYYPGYAYMGLLVSDGAMVSRRPHPDFQAALVAAPAGGGRAARVLDLRGDTLDATAPAWREVAQSFMLFDRTGGVRVRRSDQVANRTVVAEDRRGRIVIAVTEGGYPLHELAGLLRDGPLQLSHAMSMDGGYEAEMCVSAGNFRYVSFGRWEGAAGDRAPGPDAATATGPAVPLPAVIVVKAP